MYGTFPWEITHRRHGGLKLSSMSKYHIKCTDFFNIIVVDIIIVMNDLMSQWKSSQRMETSAFNPLAHEFCLFFSLDIERNSSIQICHYLLTNFIYKISCIFCNIIIFWGRNRFLKFIQIEECISSIHMKNYTFVVLCSTLKKDEISHS